MRGPESLRVRIQFQPSPPVPAKKVPQGSATLESPVSMWEIRRPEAAAPRRRGGNSASSESAPVLPPFIDTPEFEVLDEIEAHSAPGRRSAGSAATLPLAAEVPEGSVVLLIVRQQSGALSFHRPDDGTQRRRGGGAGAGVRVTFQVPLVDSPAATGRRGLFSKVVRAALVKIADWAVGKIVEHAAGWAVPILARKLEDHLWAKRPQGWLHVTPEALASASDGLRTGKPLFRNPERGLLLIHGTFSNAHAAFEKLPATGFFQEAAKLYGRNIYAFNHYTISKTPEENVADLLADLPEQDLEFDVITHSRGGLVLRELLEGSGLAHPKRKHLKIGTVVMVASPNAGTPLASSSHWDKQLSFFANLLELLPDNPFSTGAAWLAEALKWFAGNVLGNCSGLEAMDPAGNCIDLLQQPPGSPEAARYHALTSNFQPPRDWWARLADLGVDKFFKGANDLVVPTEGSWQVSEDNGDWLKGESIACFGPGGNLGPEEAVHHGAYFGHPDGVKFILSCLKGEPSGLPPIDPLVRLGGRATRAISGPGRPAASAAAASATRSTEPAATPQELVKTAVKELAAANWVDARGWDDEDTLYLTIISADNPEHFDEKRQATIMLLAQYGSARVAQPFFTRNKPGTDSTWTEEQMQGAGTRFHQIIKLQNELIDYTNGQSQARLGANVIRDLGEKLFEVLFNGQVKRLYDAATFRHRNKRLNIIFTSAVAWLSDLPWEMAYDPGYKGFISTSNVRFVRNVLTPVPADKIERKRDKLKILVVSAQAIGAGTISNEAETQRIKDSFRGLIEMGLVEVDVIVRCTPDLLHSVLRSTGDDLEYDVLHFIGHGRYDPEEGGFIEFEQDSGYSHELSARELTDIVRSRGIRIVFLNACETGRGAGKDRKGNKKDPGANYNKGVAIELAKEGLPAVVANQYSVVDQLASLFSLHFYSCLAHGLSIADSMREARIAVSGSEEAEPMDWGVPVLFSRNPNATLCKRRPYDLACASAAIEQESMLVTRRGGDAVSLLTPRKVKVAIWCTSPSLAYREDLARFSQELNQAQSLFAFAFRKRRIPPYFFSPDAGHGYLRADHIADGMEEMRKDSGAEVIFCVTDQPLMDPGTEALYYFCWDNAIIFSTWGFEPSLTGSVLRAALANHIATGLLDGHFGFSTGCESANDPRHPIHTIGYFNDERSVEHLAGPLAFQPETMQQINALIKSGSGISRDEFDAVEKILTLYHPPAEDKATVPAAVAGEPAAPVKTAAPGKIKTAAKTKNRAPIKKKAATRTRRKRGT